MSTEENDKLARAYADLRNDITRSGPGLVKVFRDQLELVLDAVAPAQEPVTVPDAPTPSVGIKVGDTIEIAYGLHYYSGYYPEGTKGTVLQVYLTEGVVTNGYPYVVKLDDSGVEINFNISEIRKVA